MPISKRPTDCALCYTTALRDNLCGMHLRMMERDRLREENPKLSHVEAERLVTQRFNKAAAMKQIVDDARALRYVIGKKRLSYRDAKVDVLRFNREQGRE